LRRGSADLHKQLAGIDKVLADAVSTSPVAALLADETQTLTERWAGGLPGHLGQGRQRADDRDRDARTARARAFSTVHGRKPLALTR